MNEITTEIEILQFAEDQWGERTIELIGLKVAEEAGEIAAAIVKIPEGRLTWADLDKEVGDILIVLSQIAAKRGWTLEQMRARRFEQIKERANRRPPCAACDRGDFQLGHSDECATARKNPKNQK